MKEVMSPVGAGFAVTLKDCPTVLLPLAGGIRRPVASDTFTLMPVASPALPIGFASVVAGCIVISVNTEVRNCQRASASREDVVSLEPIVSP